MLPVSLLYTNSVKLLPLIISAIFTDWFRWQIMIFVRCQKLDQYQRPHTSHLSLWTDTHCRFLSPAGRAGPVSAGSSWLPGVSGRPPGPPLYSLVAQSSSSRGSGPPPAPPPAWPPGRRWRRGGGGGSATSSLCLAWLLGARALSHHTATVLSLCSSVVKLLCNVRKSPLSCRLTISHLRFGRLSSLFTFLVPTVRLL